MPGLLRRHVAVGAAPSSDPAADVPGTLYIDCLFRPSSPRSELTDELYAWALSVAIPAAIDLEGVLLSFTGRGRGHERRVAPGEFRPPPTPPPPRARPRTGPLP